MPINPNNLAATATMTFDDEFATMPLSLWNGTSGTWSTTFIFADQNGNGSTLPSNGEQEWYINNNYAPTASVKPWYIQNGVLNIVAQQASSTISPLINNYQYTSGLLETSHSFSQTYGYFEISAKLPTGQGLWPAFWLLPKDGSWPPEIDGMEVLGNNTTALYTSVHSSVAGSNSYNTTVPDTSGGFHTYGVDWEQDYITWYFDNQAVYRVATPADLNKPMYMLMNLAVGGGFPGPADPNALPADMQVQWVRAYQSLPGAPVETSPSTVVAATSAGTGIAVAGASVTLATGGTATSAAMLSDGEIAITSAVSGGAGVGALFTAAGAAIGSTFALQGWDGNGLVPQITALAGGMWDVTYAEAGGPAIAAEVYNASGTMSFLNDAFTKGSPQFAALGSGGYAEASTTTAPNFLLLDSGGRFNWLSLPTNAAGTAMQPSAIQALGDNGFVFSFAGSTELDRYTFNGGVHTAIQLASAPVGTPAVAGFSDLVTEAAWVDSTGALNLQGFGPAGAAIANAVKVASSVDAGVQPQLLTTGVSDDSVLLWSAGGKVYGASYNGVTASTPVALAPGALGGVKDVVLTDGNIALTWLETDNGVQHAWVEVLNPTTMQVSGSSKHDLGASTGSLHLVALADGGFAESWHASSGIQAIAYDDRLIAYGSAVSVSGDFLGLNGAGQAVAVGTNASGQTTLQAYSFSGAATPPAVTVTLASDTGGSASDEITSNPALTGGGAPNAVVNFTVDGKAVSTTATANASGTWSFTPTGLADGPHTVTATETVSGVAGSASLTFTLDTTAPKVTEALANGVPSGGVTSNPALTGSGDPNAVVSFTVDGKAVSTTANANASGNWSFTPTGLSNGSHTVVASETDAAGNKGTASLSFTLQTTAPPVTLALVSDTGVSASDGITSNPALTGGGNANAVVNFTVDGKAVSTTATANASGTWNFTPTGLADGPHTVVATETDAAGNTGSATLSFTLDTTAPKVTEALANGVAGGGVTSSPALTGSGDPNAVVSFTVDGKAAATTATANAGGTWSFTPTGLSNGSHTVVASETDVAGNVGTASLTFTLQAAAAPVTIGLVSDTGVSASDGITSNPAVTGSADPNAVVHFTVDGTAVSATATANASGVWSFTPTGLADGSHTITATEANAAGAAGSASVGFTLDTHAAVAGVTNFTETATTGGYSLTLGGGASDLAAVQTVAIYEDGTQIGSATPAAGGAWTFTAPKTITNAVHAFTIQTTDAAGNTGAGTGELLLGTSGRETLTGGTGNDVIYGGAGADTLTGGGGADTFVYHAASEAPVPFFSFMGAYETITDFNAAADRIDLSALGLTYGGNTRTLTSHHVDWYVSGGNTYVIANVSGGTHDDMIIRLHGSMTLSSSDFILS